MVWARGVRSWGRVCAGGIPVLVGDLGVDPEGGRWRRRRRRSRWRGKVLATHSRSGGDRWVHGGAGMQLGGPGDGAGSTWGDGGRGCAGRGRTAVRSGWGRGGPSSPRLQEGAGHGIRAIRQQGLYGPSEGVEGLPASEEAEVPRLVVWPWAGSGRAGRAGGAVPGGAGGLAGSI